MIRKLFATTALAAVMATGAFAQEAETVDPSAVPQSATGTTAKTPNKPDTVGYFSASPDQILATSVLGKTVYTGADETAEAVGDVNDVVIGADGGAEAVVIGVGGFLGIGEKDVAVNFDRISWSLKDGERMMVIAATKEELQNAPAFERSAVIDAAAAVAPAEGETAGDVAADANATPAEAVVDGTATASTSPEGLKVVDPAMISAEKLMGASVRTADDTEIGVVGDVILTQDGKVAAYVIDVGGFLGMGAKPVAMESASLQVMANAEGALTVYSPFDKTQLEKQAEYSKEAYEKNPDGVVLRTTN